MVYDIFRQYSRIRQQNGDSPPNFTKRIASSEGLHNEKILHASSPPQPESSIIIPFEILKEPTRNIVRTLGALATADTDWPEVTIWCNTRVDMKDPRVNEPIERAYKAWGDLCDLLTPTYKDHDTLSIRIALASMHKYQNFNHIRTCAVEAVCWDAAVVRGLPASHPVVWLDADTPYIGYDAIEKLVAPLRNKEAHFTHANLLLTSEGDSGMPIAQRTDAEKITAVYSLTRRMIERNLAPTDNRGYVEESGLAFTIDTFYRAGGVGTSNPNIGESRGLLARAKQLLDPSIPLLKYIPDAKIANSDRRFKHIARTGPPIRLPQSEDGDDYLDYLSMESEKHDTSVRTTNRASLEEMVTFMDTRQQTRTGHQLTSKQRRHLGQAITRLGF